MTAPIIQDRQSVRAVLRGINLNAVASTLLLTTRAGGARFYPSRVVIRLVSGSAASVFCSVGSNSPGYDDVVSTVVLSSLTTVDVCFRSVIQSVFTLPAAAAGIYFNVTVAAGLECTADVILEGCYE